MKRMMLVSLLAAVFTVTVFSQAGTIRELTGDVELKRVGASEFVRAQAGSQVAMDTIVSTGFKSTAIIIVGSNEITVRPLTRLTLSEIRSSANEENLNVNLQAGRVRVEVKPPSGTRANTAVRGPSATASVRGTVFEMDTKSLNVVEGRVLYAGNTGFSFLVPGGNSSFVNMNNEAQDPIVLAAVDLLPSGPVGAGESGEESLTDANLGGTLDLILEFQ